MGKYKVEGKVRVCRFCGSHCSWLFMRKIGGYHQYTCEACGQALRIKQKSLWAKLKQLFVQGEK